MKWWNRLRRTAPGLRPLERRERPPMSGSDAKLLTRNTSTGGWKEVGSADEVIIDWTHDVAPEDLTVDEMARNLAAPVHSSFTCQLDKVNLELVSLLGGWALVDLSIDHEPHLVRGEN